MKHVVQVIEKTKEGYSIHHLKQSKASPIVDKNELLARESDRNAQMGNHSTN